MTKDDVGEMRVIVTLAITCSSWHQLEEVMIESVDLRDSADSVCVSYQSGEVTVLQKH